jgi:hypothetical protein
VAEVGNLPVLKKASLSEVGTEEGERYQRWGLRKASVPRGGEAPCAEEGQGYRGRVLLVLKKARVSTKEGLRVGGREYRSPEEGSSTRCGVVSEWEGTHVLRCWAVARRRAGRRGGEGPPPNAGCQLRRWLPS